MPITALTAGALSQYKTQRLRVVAPGTVSQELAILHRAYVLAREEWGIDFPGPIPRTRKPPQPKGRTRRVSDEELDRVLAATESAELRIIARFALATAMRRGELTAMRWEDVDLRKRSVFLPVTKNGHSRTVPLSKWAVELLRSAASKDTGPVFTLRPDSVSQMFCYAARRAGVLDIRFHDLRHEATSRLFEKGLNQIEVSRITGHLTLSMLSRYTHLSVSHLLQKLDAAEPEAQQWEKADSAKRRRQRAQARRKRGTLGRWKKRRTSGD
ncbi:site-specific integrase [Bordetella sp. H567]|uniref:site-specific integrase n=1 Tax=Bordetella sp. H567 TaxID=1697043 RepID=UPI0013144408|nr:site-specific integrase [Bordetella sp. H567]